MYTYNIKLDRVIDGDTIDAYIDLGFDIHVKKRIRFMGINTPESRTRDLEEKARGLAAKDRLKAILDGADNKFDLESKEVGKFGRVLGRLHVDKLDGKDLIAKVCVNDCLVKEGYAAEYDGGKREKVKVVEKQDLNEDVPFGD